MNLIVAIDMNGAIAYQGRLLARIPQDLQFFKAKTLGKVVIMGRKTLEAMPNGRPLPDRLNIIISSQKDYKVSGAIRAGSIQGALEAAAGYKEEDIFIIGGETIYRQMLDMCKVAYVTKIKKKYKADTFFPNLDKMKEWRLVKESDEQIYEGLKYSFCKYEKLS